MNMSCLLNTSRIVLLTIITMTTSAVAIGGQGTWESTLKGRDLDGNASTIEAYYDTVLDITWLADAGAAGTILSWSDARNWAANLKIKGFRNWRLPRTQPVNGSTYNYNNEFDGSSDYGYSISALGTTYAGSTGSELAHMYYNTLGNLAYWDSTGTVVQTGWHNGIPNAGPFSNVVNTVFWSETGYAPNTDDAWSLSFYGGNQWPRDKNLGSSVWAVHDGDIGKSAATPPPAPEVLTLNFPLDGHDPYTTRRTSIFDHSIISGNKENTFKKDGKIVTNNNTVASCDFGAIAVLNTTTGSTTYLTGEDASSKCTKLKAGKIGRDGNLYAYLSAPLGTGEAASDGNYYWYDGHPGYDYPGTYGSLGPDETIIAAAGGSLCLVTGVTKKPKDSSPWRDRKKCPVNSYPSDASCDWNKCHTFYIVHNVGGIRYTTWYLHSEIETGLYDQVILNGYVDVTKSQKIATESNFGPGSGKHLHFEVRTNIDGLVDPYGFNGSPVLWE